MSNETADLVLTCIGITIGLCTLAGMFAKFVALPWIKEHVITPVKETQHQVTVNGHVSRDPTLLDKVDSLQSGHNHIKDDLATAARMFEGHIERSAGEWGRLWRAIDELDARTRTTHREDQHDD